MLNYVYLLSRYFVKTNMKCQVEIWYIFMFGTGLESTSTENLRKYRNWVFGTEEIESTRTLVRLTHTGKSREAFFGMVSSSRLGVEQVDHVQRNLKS